MYSFLQRWLAPLVTDTTAMRGAAAAVLHSEPQLGAAPAPATAPTAQAAPAAQPAPWMPAHADEFIREEAVSPGRLLSLFKQAFHPVEALTGNRLLVTTDGGMRMQVVVDSTRKLLAFSATYAMQAAVPMDRKLAFVNRANERVIFVRFTIINDTTLYVDHHLPFNGGVTPAAVIASFRTVGRVTPHTINELAAPGMF